LKHPPPINSTISQVEELDLSHNQLDAVLNLHECAQLRTLNVGFNRLRSLGPLHTTLGNVTKLILRSNGLTSTAGLEKMYSLQVDNNSNSPLNDEKHAILFCFSMFF
jgi:Leucine-rich repeat (LRR) protein